MLDKLKKIFGGAPTPPDSSRDDSTFEQRTLAQERSAQMDLAERDRRIEVLQTEIQRLSTSQQNLVDESVNGKLGTFFTEVAGPVSQLLTQIHLVDNQNRDVNAMDTLRLVKRLIRHLEEAGLQICSPAGVQVKFDPNYHESLSSDTVPKPGDVVVVRIPGLAHGGRIIRKAGVASEG
jgi:molecular chaperone GrpE (heat shock protein)